ncbi:MAG: hypothetical protein E7403_00925 [Ruminococcaceae bacterium]|nr:hypothetical protein [Oscillospiraceae bacterium]
MALISTNKIIFSLVLIARVKNMANYKILSNTEKHTRYNNMKNRCGKYYQLQNPRYEGTYMCDEWLDNKYETFFTWLDNNYYEVDGEKQMDIDKDIIKYGNKLYHPDLCLVVPHSINTFYETIEVGKTNITYNSKTKKYRVKVADKNEYHELSNIDTYNEALDIYCDIKQGILFNKAKALKDKVPEKVYNALMNTDIKAINQKYCESVEGEV